MHDGLYSPPFKAIPRGRHARRNSADSSDVWRKSSGKAGQSSEAQKRKWRASRNDTFSGVEDLLDTDFNPLDSQPGNIWDDESASYTKFDLKFEEADVKLGPVGPGLQRSQSMKSPVGRKGSAARNRTSRYIGVGSSNRKNQWQARILVHGKVTHLGYYRSEEEAAMVYDRVAVSLNGPGATTNFPASRYMKSGPAEFIGLGREDLQRALGVKPMDKSSRFRGVSRKKGKWEAKVMVNRKWAYRALFDSEDEAAHAYDAAVRRLKPREASSFVNFGSEDAARKRPPQPVLPATRSKSQKLTRPKNNGAGLKRNPHSFPDILTLDEAHIPNGSPELDAPSTPTNPPSLKTPVSPFSGTTMASNIMTSTLFGDLSSTDSLTADMPISMHTSCASPMSKSCNSLSQMSTVATSVLNLPDPNSIGVPPPENVPFPELVSTPFASNTSGEPMLQSQKSIGLPPLQGHSSGGLPPLQRHNSSSLAQMQSHTSGGLTPLQSHNSGGLAQIQSHNSGGLPPLQSHNSGGPPRRKSSDFASRRTQSVASRRGSLDLPQIPPPILEPSTMMPQENGSHGLDNYFANMPTTQELVHTLPQSQQAHCHEMHQELQPTQPTRNPFQEVSGSMPAITAASPLPLARASSGAFPPTHPHGNLLTKLRSMPESELDRLTQTPLQMGGGLSPAPGSISRAASEHVLRRQASAVTPPLHGVHFSGLPDDILGGQQSFACLPHQLSATNGTAELKRSMMGQTSSPALPLKMAKGILTNQGPGLPEHAEIDCDLGRDFAPINQHYGGLQSLSATGVTYVPDVNPGVQSQACNRGLATYASLPTSLEGSMHMLQGGQHSAQTEAMPGQMCTGVNNEVIGDNATDLLDGLLRENVDAANSQGVQIGGEFLHAYDSIDLAGDAFMLGRTQLEPLP